MKEPYAVPSSVKTKKTPMFNLPQNNKTLEFFSTIGKSRLNRICEDNNLNEEVIFTGGCAGPSESFVKEQVSDFVQHHLYRRHRRISLERQYVAQEICKSKPTFEKRPTVFVHYEKFIKKSHECMDKKRRDQEKERLIRMLISGEIHNVPTGFEWVLDEPDFKMNRFIERVRDLEQQDYRDLQPIPFATKYIKPIRVINEKEICPEKSSAIKNQKSQSNWLAKLKSVKKSEILKAQGTSSVSPAVSSLQMKTEDSSGVTDNSWTPSPSMSSQSKYLTPRSDSAETDDGIEMEGEKIQTDSAGFSQPKKMSNQERQEESFRIPIDASLEEIQDENELWSIAGQLYPDEEFSGELEIIHVSPLYKSEPVWLIQAEESCDKMYEVGSQIVSLYERQEVVGIEFIEEMTTTQVCLK